jgi:saccharopine dehydrogenase (NADP+, L-glutamate forming)
LTQKVLNAASDSEVDLKSTVLARIFLPKEEIDNVMRGLKWLGIFSPIPVTRRGNLLDSLCALLEEKMQYAPGERDMVMLQHKFEIMLPTGPQVTLSVK